MRSLERHRHEEDPLYQVATYLASLDQLFDEQASILREQTHRAEQAELAIRMHQIRVAQAEARAAAAVSSEAVAQESSGRPGTCVYKNGPEEERQSRQLEKLMSFLGPTSWDGDRFLGPPKPHPRTLKGLLLPLKENLQSNPWQMET